MRQASRADLDPIRLEEALGIAARLVGEAEALAIGLADLSVDLPPPSAAAVDSAQLKAVAGLYLAAELENAGVVPVVEGLAALAATGSLRADPGDAARALAAFWRARGDRPSAEERAAIFSRLFGREEGPDAADHAGYDDFILDMIELAEALYRLDETAAAGGRGSIAAQTRVRRAAERLIDALARASGALTSFIAAELIDTLKQALAILKERDLQRALGARDSWSAVDAGARLVGLPVIGARLYAERGRAGMTVVAWLAEAAPHLAGGAPLVGLDHPVIPAAADWLEAALTISELEAGRAEASGSTGGRRSGWAALAA